MKLTFKNYRCFTEADPLQIELKDGLTAILGPNNVGKSAALRALYDFRPLWASCAHSETLVNNVRGYLNIQVQPENESFESLASDASARPLAMSVDVSDRFTQSPAEGVVRSVTFRFPRGARPEVDFDARAVEFLGKYKPDWKTSCDPSEILNAAKLDVSVLCDGLRRLSRVFYIGAVRHALNAAGSGHVFDLDLGNQLLQRWHRLLSGKDKQTRDNVLRLLGDIGSHFGLKTFDVRLNENATSLVLTCDGRTYDLRDVGEGIAQFLIILGNLHGASPSWIVIDEPESGLHPRLQQLLLQQLLARAESGVIFATHSMALARSANHPLVLQRAGDGRRRLSSFAGVRSLGELMGELGVAQFVGLGLDRVLLVEGPTDAMVVRELLARWGAGAGTAVFPLGGSSLINADAARHLSEFKSVSEHVYAVIDSERTAEGRPLSESREKFRRACKDVGIECHVLDRRAMENYLTDRAIKAVMGEKYGALEPFTLVRDVAKSWGKEDNWRIANEMRDEEWMATDLGEFLRQRVCLTK